jgi:hypothetical protein
MTLMTALLLLFLILEPTEPFTRPVDVLVCSRGNIGILCNTHHGVVGQPEEVFHIFKHHLDCTVVSIQCYLSHNKQTREASRLPQYPAWFKGVVRVRREAIVS